MLFLEVQYRLWKDRVKASHNGLSYTSEEIRQINKWRFTYNVHTYRWKWWTWNCTRILFQTLWKMIFALYQKVKHTDHIKHNNDEVTIPVFSDSITMYRSTHDICTYHNMYNLTKTSSSRRVFLEHTWSWLDHVGQETGTSGMRYWNSSGFGELTIVLDFESFLLLLKQGGVVHDCPHFNENFIWIIGQQIEWGFYPWE